jgi:hypothetical protein
MQKPHFSVVVILVIVLSLAACARQRTTTQTMPSEAPAAAVRATDVNALAGKWHGWYMGTSGGAQPLQVDVRPDGTYTSRIGTLTGTGTFQVSEGKILTSGELLGPQAPFERAAVATLMDRKGRPVIRGEGKTTRGPYTFEIVKD